jgi:hypothetical protein
LNVVTMKGAKEWPRQIKLSGPRSWYHYCSCTNILPCGNPDDIVSPRQSAQINSVSTVGAIGHKHQSPQQIIYRYLRTIHLRVDV